MRTVVHDEHGIPRLAELTTRRLALVVSEEEAAMFRSLAEAEGMTVSGWIRQAARQAYRRMTTAKAKRAVKRRTR